MEGLFIQNYIMEEILSGNSIIFNPISRKRIICVRIKKNLSQIILFLKIKLN